MKDEGNGKLEKVEASLAKARALIREASMRNSNIIETIPEDQHADNYVPHGDIYRNAFVFHRYELSIIYFFFLKKKCSNIILICLN
jgi:hypothetical protein